MLSDKTINGYGV